MAANNQPVNDPIEISTEALLKPSIFDSDEIKDLRAFLQDMVDKLQETREQERINAEL
jgi:TPP-dependent pyruvate/acetoin dehydrogenase alpha subunit